MNGFVSVEGARPANGYLMEMTHRPRQEFTTIVQTEAQNESTIPPSREDSEQRALMFKGRHIQMMALGSSLSSSLFLQMGRVLLISGPVSMLLGNALMGTVAWAMLISLGEMMSLLPVPGGFIVLANRTLSPAVGFVCGWSYWLSRAISFGLELVALQKVMAIWLSDENYAYMWITIFFIIIVLFNFLNVRRYGEIEFWLTVTKLVTIVGIIILGLVLVTGASAKTRQLGTSSDNTAITCPSNSTEGQCVPAPGFAYWGSGLAWHSWLYDGDLGRLLSFWAACCQSSYLGLEIIGIVAEETERQRETIPSAVRRVAYRGFLYHIGILFVLGLNVSSNDPILKFIVTENYTSPFELMVQRAGIPSLTHVINAATVIAILGGANTRLYVSARVLMALAKERQAPEIFHKTGKWNVPIYSLAVSALPGLLAFMSVKISSNTVFNILQLLLAPCVWLSWAVICATYLRFHYAVDFQNLTPAIPPKARSPLQPYLAVYGLAMCLLQVLFQGYLVFARAKLPSGTPWIPYTMPWVTLGALTLLTIGWYVYRGIFKQSWDWKIPSVIKVDLSNGAAPLTPPYEESDDWFVRVRRRVLDKL